MSCSSTTEVTIIFRTSYNTYPGQQLFVIGDHPHLGVWKRAQALEMRYIKDSVDEFNWVGRITFRKTDDQIVSLDYKYIILTSAIDSSKSRSSVDVRLEAEAQIYWDSGSNRNIVIGKVSKSPFIITTSDLFQPPLGALEPIFFKNSFRDVIYRHDINKKAGIIVDIPKGDFIQVRFRVIPLQLPPEYNVCITGDSPIFGNWKKYEVLTPINPIYYEFVLNLPKDTQSFDYKYLIVGPAPKNEVKWEHRHNRRLVISEKSSNVLLCCDWLLKMPIVKFHGSGILVPLFSLRSRNSYQGIGEYMDLKLLIDWAVRANQLMIQLLPIQDTIFSLDGSESNHSRQVSAFAFNPIYLSLRMIAGFKSIKPMRRFDFQSVYIAKIACLQDIFSKVDRPTFRKNKKFISFVKNNSNWLQTYCLWAAIRDDWILKNPPRGRKEGVRPEWPKITDLQIPDILKNSREENIISIQCLFHAWIQFQCHLQLKTISKYAKANRIILSCGMTIGQCHNSADTWANPGLFNENYNLGSPPDIFSFHGQNWWYPSWNWEEMKKTNYKWIQEQIAHRERYFAACLFDHPLGLFRCWIIPSDIENPLLGHYVPSIPLDVKDFNDLQIRDISRFCRPIFPINDVLSFSMQESTKERIINMLATCDGGIWRFRAQYETDTSVKKALDFLSDGLDTEQKLQFSLAEKILLAQHEGVCLIPDREQPHRKFYPRFSMTDSTIFKLLPERDAQIMYKLFVDFYYRTNYSLWHENGAQNLSALSSSSIQFFGYDLGVSLNDEEKALHRVGICSYRVQRIPRESTQRFDPTSSFPYLSICTPSPHDLPHLASWWKQEQADVQFFYHQILKMTGIAPPQINPEIVHNICHQNLVSDSMWCLFVFEDLLALSDEFINDISDIWINNPSSPYKGLYRLGVLIDDLLEKHDAWTQNIANLIEESGRGRKSSHGFSEISE